VLVVETRAKVFALPVAWEYEPGLGNVRARDVWTPEPYLAAIVQLDPRRSQLVIARNHGASNAFVSFVGIADGKLVLLPFRPREYGTQYRLTEGLLQRTSSTTTTASRKRINTLSRQAGMDALPFTGCAIARGRRL
jgi:hypothetical protein